MYMEENIRCDKCGEWFDGYYVQGKNNFVLCRRCADNGRSFICGPGVENPYASEAG
jgi:formylmethanofuran dehydrogenase subunit E